MDSRLRKAMQAEAAADTAAALTKLVPRQDVVEKRLSLIEETLDRILALLTADKPAKGGR